MARSVLSCPFLSLMHVTIGEQKCVSLLLLFLLVVQYFLLVVAAAGIRSMFRLFSFSHESKKVNIFDDEDENASPLSSSSSSFSFFAQEFERENYEPECSHRITRAHKFYYAHNTSSYAYGLPFSPGRTTG